MQRVRARLKIVVHSAGANVVHSFGLDPDPLLVALAFIGKGFLKKRSKYHAKMRYGTMVRPEYRLTIVVRESTSEEEAEVAKLRVSNFKKLTKRERKKMFHTNGFGSITMGSNVRDLDSFLISLLRVLQFGAEEQNQ